MTSSADGIVPDTKNWTWVLERPCPECGLDTREVAPEQVAGLLREVTASWRDVLAGGVEILGDVTARPDPATWSPLEYGCHVRDTFRVFEGRLQMMLAEDDPLFANWDQDKTAVEERYREQDPTTVAAELAEAGAVVADHFGSVTGDQWERTGARDDGSRFTVTTFARYLVHDPIHHLYDVTGARAT
ncbi:MAG: DinB family protein [Sporichthyaceae bacterium]